MATGSDVRVALVSLVAAIVGGAVTGGLSYFGTTRQMDVKMVEIAVGILSQEPKDNIEPARVWAVDVISHYSQVKLSDDVKTALIQNRALVVTFYGGYDSTFYGGYDSTFYGGYDSTLFEGQGKVVGGGHPSSTPP